MGPATPELYSAKASKVQRLLIGFRRSTRVENNRRPRLRGGLGLTAEARRAEAVEIWTLRSGRAALFLRPCGGHDVLKCTITP